jgi:integrase
MRWEHLDRQARVLRVPETKTGEPRWVPLSSRALAVLDAQPRRIDGYVWGIRADSITRAFDRVMRWARAAYEAECKPRRVKPDATMLTDLRFHDLRHEATSRLFEIGLNPMQAAAITGHQTLQMLKRYTHLRVEDLVDRLG